MEPFDLFQGLRFLRCCRRDELLMDQIESVEADIETIELLMQELGDEPDRGKTGVLLRVV
jgi:hypothetical protein